MEKRILGRTGLAVTAVSFGALPIQRCTMEEAGRVLHAALDAGINFIDTARAYTDSEEKIGRHIAGRRSEYYLATKSFSRTAAGILKDIETSLATLKTDYIDLYQVHNIKNREDLGVVMAPGGAIEGLKAAKKAGKIGWIGITSHNIELLVEAIRTNEFDTVQVPFNCVEQEALKELFPLAASMNIGRIVMKPMGGGLIPDKKLSLRFILEHDISVVIPGMDDVRHIEENFKALENFQPLSLEERERLMADAAAIGKTFCRRCGYCMPCAAGIDIPTVFVFHHQYRNYGMDQVIPKRYAALGAKASDCIECGACEKRCPYNIPIREWMKKVAADLD